MTSTDENSVLLQSSDSKWKDDDGQDRHSDATLPIVCNEDLASSDMVFAVSQLIVGVGAFSFATGPYVDLISAITSLKGSSIATTLLSRTPICAQGTFNMSLGAGIGYSMPRVVANVINTVLGWFGVKPIQSSGSIIALPKRKNLIEHKDELPNGCSG